MFLRRESARAPAAVAAALEYHRLGWSVVPLDPQRLTPLVDLEPWRYRAAQPWEIGDWFGRCPDAGVGVVTGFVSGVVALTLTGEAADARAGAAAGGGALPETVESAGRGWRQLFFRHPGTGLGADSALAPGVVLRGEGGWVAVPPSRDPAAGLLGWVVSPAVRAPVPLPAWVLERARSLAAGVSAVPLLRSAAEGEARGGAATALAARLLSLGLPREEVLAVIECWSRARCRPPLDDAMLARVLDETTRGAG